MKIRDIIKKYAIRPCKRKGQHFLADPHITEKIISALSLSPRDTVLEIGAGFGIMTKDIAPQVEKLIAVECDRKLCTVLEEEISAQWKSCVVIPESILSLDLKKIAGKKKMKVVGNLPYYLTSPILFYLIDARAVISRAVLMMQKEVADRLLATPGNKQYGRLTVSVRFFAECERVCTVHPGSFFPPPEVTSSVIRMVFRENKESKKTQALFLDVVAALFQERRKTVHNGLCLLKSRTLSKKDAGSALEEARIDPKRRAEELMMKDFLSLTRVLQKR